MTRETVTIDLLELAAIAAGLGDQLEILEERVRPLITARLEPEGATDATALDALQ
jgi:hypothetical protein